MAHARLGEFAEAQDAVDRAFEVSRKSGSVVNGADVALGSSLAFLDMGDVRRGLEYSQQGTDQALSAHGLECAMYGHYCTGSVICTRATPPKRSEHSNPPQAPYGQPLRITGLRSGSERGVPDSLLHGSSLETPRQLRT